MHGFKPLADAFHNSFDLLHWEFVLVFDFVIQLATFQKLHANINWILWLVNLVKFHEIFVIKGSHNLNLIDEGLFSFLLTESSFFWEGLHSVFFSIFILDDQINWSKVSFSYFFDRFKEFMETSLIDFFPKDVSPLKKFCWNIGVFERKELVIPFEF